MIRIIKVGIQPLITNVSEIGYFRLVEVDCVWLFYEFIMQIFIPNGNFLFSASQVQYQKAEVFVKKTYFDGSLTSH